MNALQPLLDRLSQVTELPCDEISSLLTEPPKADLGDYAFPCFPLAKKLRQKPQEIAARIAEELASGDASDVVESATATGPYVNIRLRREPVTTKLLQEIHAKGDGFGATEQAQKTVVIDFSSPNMAKPFHVGHLSSTIIGGSLSRLFAFEGHRVVRINHLGDWGTPIGQQIAAFRRWGDKELLETHPIAHVVDLYQRFHREKENDPTLEPESREWFRKLETGDPEAREFWQHVRKLSIKALEETYARLGVEFDHYQGEAFYEDMLDETNAKVLESGIAEESQGAVIVPLESRDIETPLILRKSDGGTTYATRDIAAAMFRAREFGFDECLYVVARDQELHFQQLFATLELMGLDWAERMVHVKFGHVHGMSTRKGGAILLEDLLARATGKVEEIIRQNQETMFAELTDDDVREVAEAVGVGAVIFGTLNRKRIKDSEFSWDTALNFTGETGPYVQYAHARLCSILRKAGRPVPETPDYSLLKHDAEWGLVRTLARFGDEVEAACRNYEPSFVAKYLLDLAQSLTKFYDQCRVIGEDEALTGARLALVDAVRQVIRTGLGLLCMKAPERM